MRLAFADVVAQACSGFESIDLTARDETKLRGYEYGPRGKSSVLIINPIGVPIVVASRLARALGERYRVTCWEQRGYGAAPDEFASKAHGFSAFVSDVLDVVAQRAAEPCVVIGVCSGAALAIRAIATGVLRASTLILVSPSVRFDGGYVPSIFDQAMIPYMRAISGGNRVRAKELLAMHRAKPAPPPADHVPSKEETAVQTADTASLESLDSLMVYAKTVQAFADERFDSDIPKVRQKVWVIAAQDDQTVAIQTVRRLCELLPEALLHEYPEGGHHMIYLKAEVRDAILRIVEGAG